MNEYLLLFRGGDDQTAGKSPEELQANMQKWAQWMGRLAEEGKFSGAQPLNAQGKVLKGPQKVVTDGPFIEGKEIIGGYLICKAGSFDEAVSIAQGCPVLNSEDGSVEVREIRDMVAM